MENEQDTGLTQNEKFAAKLLEIKPEVTTEDRRIAKEETGLTPETISRYLNGTVNDADTAAGLLMIFRRRIQDREKLIEEPKEQTA